MVIKSEYPFMHNGSNVENPVIHVVHAARDSDGWERMFTIMLELGLLEILGNYPHMTSDSNKTNAVGILHRVDFAAGSVYMLGTAPKDFTTDPAIKSLLFTEVDYR